MATAGKIASGQWLEKNVWTKLRIWGSGVQISSGAPALSTHLPCKKYCRFTEFTRNGARANSVPNALMHRGVVGANARVDALTVADDVFSWMSARGFLKKP